MDSVSVSMCVPNQTWRASLIRANGPLVPRASRRVFVSFNAVAYENTQQSMLMLLHIPTPKITNTQGTQILLYHTNGLQKKTTAYSGCRYAALCSPRHGNPVRYYLFSCLVWLIREFGVAELMQEAIQNNDIFYLILSQAFCLHTRRHPLLPELLQGVLPESWCCLGKLLRSNEELSPPVVAWFAAFPAPAEEIFGTGAHYLFWNQLNVVKHFLCELPYRWAIMVEASKCRQAPPLTEEMVQELNSNSPIVQTAAFRAVVRSLWGWDDPRLGFLELLQKTDQATYTKQHWRRSPAERDIAYEVLKCVHDVLEQHRPRPRASIVKYVLTGAYELFRETPPSMQRTWNFEVDNGNGQSSRGAAQGVASGERGGNGRAGNGNSIEGVTGADSTGVDATEREG
jgi:hypothetical protein